MLELGAKRVVKRQMSKQLLITFSTFYDSNYMQAGSVGAILRADQDYM